jgi:predicted methyltransferase
LENIAMRQIVSLLTMFFAAATSMAAAAPAVDPGLAAAIASNQRTANFVARDAARHPAEELTFFGLKADANVVELWPGGGYWTEILAPYLAAHGHYTAALPPTKDSGEDSATVAQWRARIAPQAARFGTVQETTLGKGHFDIAPPGSADLILTFRNLHNWMEGGYAAEALAACLRALKPGGVLGIEDHRGSDKQPQDPLAKSGYVRQDYAINLVKQAGFEFVGSSEVDANPKDTKDWPSGVWTLPPTLELGEKDRAKYMAIGEADNFVLKFRKPKHS